MLQSRTLAALLRASRGGGVQPNRPVRVVRLFFRCQTAVSSSGSADVAFLKTAVSFRPATRKIQACNTRTQIKRGRKRTGWSDKCLEAPHLKAVCTVRRVAGIEVRRVEVQVQAADAVDRRRPAIPVVADVPQRSLAVAAVTRGGCPYPARNNARGQNKAQVNAGGTAPESRGHGHAECCVGVPSD